MANPSKDKGTRAETAVVNYLHWLGFTDARRLPLSGVGDIGDVEFLVGRVTVQVKAGKAAERASDNQILEWLSQAENQASNGGFEKYYLVTKRSGYGLGRIDGWWLHFHGPGRIPMRTNLKYLATIVGETCN